MRNPGIPYFPLDCQLDEKFQLIEAEFGLKGFAVVVKLLQRIYGINGYYCEWTNDIELLFSMQIGEGRNFVSDIVQRALERGIFSSEMYEKYHILTSNGIQKRYLAAVGRRKNTELDERYVIVPATHGGEDVDSFGENVNIFEENVDISTQRREKKRKEKKSKEEERKEFVVDNFKNPQPILSEAERQEKLRRIRANLKKSANEFYKTHERTGD